MLKTSSLMLPAETSGNMSYSARALTRLPAVTPVQSSALKTTQRHKPTVSSVIGRAVTLRRRNAYELMKR